MLITASAAAPMETTTLDDFMAWNDQLAAAVQAGVPLDLGLPTYAGDVAGGA